MTSKFQSAKIGKSQHELLESLSKAGSEGCTTAQLAISTGLHLRTIQDSMRRLNARGLVKKFGLKHNKNRWYYSEIASDFLAYWPQLPPHAKDT